MDCGTAAGETSLTLDEDTSDLGSFASDPGGYVLSESEDCDYEVSFAGDVEDVPAQESEQAEDDMLSRPMQENPAKRQKLLVPNTDPPVGVPDTDPPVNPAVEPPSAPNPAVEPPTGTSSAPSGVHRTSTKVHVSPDEILQPISPYPACIISLSFKDHRWVARWRKKMECEEWLDELKNKSYSLTFDHQDPSDWQSKLSKVHDYAWSKWEIGRPSLSSLLTLASGIAEQTPGEISEQTYTALAPIVASLPPKEKYPDLPIDPCFIRPLFDKGLFLQKNRGFFLEK